MKSIDNRYAYPIFGLTVLIVVAVIGFSLTNSTRSASSSFIITLKNNNSESKPYTIEAIDQSGAIRQLDIVKTQPGYSSNPVPFASAMNTAWYISDRKIYAIKPTSPKLRPVEVLNLANVLKKDEVVIQLAINSTATKAYLYLFPEEKTDTPLINRESFTLAEVDLATGQRSDLITDNALPNAQFPSDLSWFGDNGLIFSVGYGDAGAQSETVYLASLTDKKHYPLISLASDGSNGGTLGNTIYKISTAQGYIIADNLQEKIKSIDRDPLTKDDYESVSNQGQIKFFSAAGVTKESPLDLGSFTVIKKAEPIYSAPEGESVPMSSAIATAVKKIFYVDGTVYIEAVKPANAEYYSADSKDGYYAVSLADNSRKTIDKAVYAAALAKHLKLNRDPALMIGDRRVMFNYTDGISLEDELTGEKKNVGSDLNEVIGVISQ